MKDQKFAVAENLMEDRAKIVQEMIEQLRPIMKEKIGTAVVESSDLSEEENAVLEQQLTDELIEYIRRGLQRGVKRLYTEHTTEG